METNEINGLENIEGIEEQNEGDFHALRYSTSLPLSLSLSLSITLIEGER